MRPTSAPLAALALLAAASTPALALAQEALAPDVVCKEEKETCREDCTLDYGMSESTRGKVPKCLADCEQAEVICLARFVAKRHAGQAKADRERYAQPAEETSPAPPMDEDLPPVRKRTATRAADLKAAPSKDVERYQEKVFHEPVPEGAPAPAVKPAPAPVEMDPGAPPPTKAVKKKKKKAATPATEPVTPAE